MSGSKQQQCFRDVLIRGGNAVDAAIATAICTGALHPHATGFGGGMVMLVHDRRKNETTVISAYPAAPRSATEETYLLNPALAKIGYSSISTPGFLHGIWTAFKRYGSGRIAWQDLLIPTVILLERGTPASRYMVEAIQSRKNEMVSEKSMSTTYNVTMSEGEIFRDPIHAGFLRRLAIARDPVELFYRGEISNQIVHEMKQRGGLLTKTDLASYSTQIEAPLEIALTGGFVLKGPQAPSAFSALATVVQIIMSRFSGRSDLSMDTTFARDLIMAQRLALTRLEQIGDPEFTLSDSVLSVLQDSLEDLNDTDTSTAEAKSMPWNQSGFVWNNDLSAFTLRDKESSEDVDVNAIEGRKRARTLMSPMMLFDQHGALITSVGVTGSLNSLMAAAQVLVNQMLFNKNVVSELWEEFSMSPQLYHDSRVHGLSLLNNGFAESACDFRDGSELCSEGF
ncbi:unnamed protein product [Heligmosomoides polygyrus]|uniref:Gamma-glutamyltransferase n=1 Tax=Heligmosomoides polygyrus TaxID=6339 RepID=A0A3P8BYC2_HELPZ|nr:unnamed protein product [Heligmosomoides polygyrus]